MVPKVVRQEILTELSGQTLCFTVSGGVFLHWDVCRIGELDQPEVMASFYMDVLDLVNTLSNWDWRLHFRRIARGGVDGMEFLAKVEPHGMRCLLN